MAQKEERTIYATVRVKAPIDQVWNVWTTEDGILSFFAPACNMELCVDGPYEMLFDLDAEPGFQGGEGVKILAIQPPKMLSFTWNAPPHLPTVRNQRTHVVVRLEPVSDTETRVTLRHDGWGDSDEWNQAFAYFSVAWQEVVLPRLQFRFDVGPVDWDNPPKFV